MMLTIVLASFFLLAAGDSKPRVYQPAKELIKDINSGKKLIDNDNARIIGGDPVNIEEHPWQVSLQYGGSHSCGGSILDENNILTAAHCVDGRSPSFMSIRGGHNRHESKNDDGAETRGVSDFIVHASYNKPSAGISNDIAILHLSNPLVLNNVTIKAVSLPESPDQDFLGNEDCWITGWGRHTSGQTLPENLQGANISPITNAECSSEMSGIQGATIHSTHICPFEGNMGSCNGDSGGPYVCKVDTKFVLAGVTSWGIQDNRSRCLTSYPSVYVRVSKYLTWISNHMKDMK